MRDRPRKTGPRHPLAVLRCTTHDCGFTLYPPGFGPYLRAPVLRRSPDGGEVRSPTGSDLSGTIFDAALDAAAARPWNRGASTTTTAPLCWWSSQGRLIEGALRFLGLGASQSHRLRDAVAQVLSVGGLVLRDQAALAHDGGGYRSRGLAIKTVLDAALRTTSTAMRLLTCGHVTGRWGKPLQWDPLQRRLWTVPFRLPGTAPPS